MKRLLFILFLMIGFTNNVFGAVGCDLNDPDRDVKRLFPSSTGYKTTYMSLEKLGGDAMLKNVEERLGDKFSGLYETIDVPYTIYTIFNNKNTIGYIHGINQKGKYGGLQVFLGYDIKGKITNFYYQKLTSRDAKYLRSTEFATQFKGLSLLDFNDYNPKTHAGIPKNIATLDDSDFWATLRAVKKNLILMDIFIFNNKVIK